MHITLLMDTYEQNGFGYTVIFVVTQYLVLLMQNHEPLYVHHPTLFLYHLQSHR